MDHHWVAKAWLSDVGLPQYSQAFHNHLVDGRMLNSLTRHDLERHLNISKKFHQVSLLLGIELLHSLNFDKEVSGTSHLAPDSYRARVSQRVTRLYLLLFSLSLFFRLVIIHYLCIHTWIILPFYFGIFIPWVKFICFQALQARRVQCEHQNVDPLVWTSHRVVKWVKDIDLKVGT